MTVKERNNYTEVRGQQLLTETNKQTNAFNSVSSRVRSRRKQHWNFCNNKLGNKRL